ncbi:MAG TPA: hypothetical protein VFN23_04165 [Ktedonobacteraceae bacterium]|nr:hypothetical protein [Ktedonobacteraceae bacterium]
MKTAHLYGVSAMLMVMALLAWLFAAWLWWIGLFLLVSGALTIAIGLFRLWAPAYVQVAAHRHTQALAWQSIALQERVLAHGERHGASIKRDSNGTIEVMIEARSKPAQLAPPVVDSEPGAIPLSVRYEEIQSQIPRGHALLGVSENGIETCDFGHLLTMWICGGSSTGKSNTVAIKLDEAIQLGRDIGIILIDPHARKEDSLYHKIRCYEHRFLLPVAVNEDDILQALTAFKEEFERRLEVGSGETDILLVVDEVSNVVDSDNEEIGKLIKKIARICGQEARGFGMFGWFISQDAAGLAWLRKRAMTVITHKLNMMSERKLACNEDMELARSMDRWPIGRVAVYGLHFTGTLVAQMPVKTARYDEGEKIYPSGWMEPLQLRPPALFDEEDQEAQFPHSEGNLSTEKFFLMDDRDHSDERQNRLSDSQDLRSSEGPKEYRLSDLETEQFLTAYRASGNIEKSLTALGRGSRFKPHARELIKAHGLRKE